MAPPLWARPNVVAQVSATPKSDERSRMFRLGTVTAKATGPPKTVTVDGRVMRYLAAYTASTGDVVVWVREGSDPLCLGKLA